MLVWCNPVEMLERLTVGKQFIYFLRPGWHGDFEMGEARSNNIQMWHSISDWTQCQHQRVQVGHAQVGDQVDGIQAAFNHCMTNVATLIGMHEEGV